MNDLRRRMTEDMRIRNYSKSTITSYIRSVARFAEHFKRSPRDLGPEHIREYQLFLINSDASVAKMTHTVCGLRFLYTTTLNVSWSVKKMLGVRTRPSTRGSAAVEGR